MLAMQKIQKRIDKITRSRIDVLLSARYSNFKEGKIE
jgi:hypothetical protein